VSLHDHIRCSCCLDSMSVPLVRALKRIIKLHRPRKTILGESCGVCCEEGICATYRSAMRALGLESKPRKVKR